jgi:hypothetical protein
MQAAASIHSHQITHPLDTHLLQELLLMELELPHGGAAAAGSLRMVVVTVALVVDRMMAWMVWMDGWIR